MLTSEMKAHRRRRRVLDFAAGNTMGETLGRGLTSTATLTISGGAGRVSRRTRGEARFSGPPRKRLLMHVAGFKLARLICP